MTVPFMASQGNVALEGHRMMLAQSFLFKPTPSPKLAPTPARAPTRTALVGRAPPTPLAVELRRARDAMASGNSEEALACFDRVLAATPDLKLARAGRLVSLASLGRADDLMQDIIENLSERQGDVIIELARATIATGNAVLTLNVLKIVSAFDPHLCAPLVDDSGFAALRDHPLFLQLAGML